VFTLEHEAELDVFDKFAEVVALEECCELLQERLHVLKVDKILLVAELELEKVEDERVRIHVCVIHVRFDGLSEVIQADFA